jgi:hypothetical protein
MFFAVTAWKGGDFEEARRLCEQLPTPSALDYANGLFRVELSNAAGINRAERDALLKRADEILHAVPTPFNAYALACVRLAQASPPSNDATASKLLDEAEAFLLTAIETDMKGMGTAVMSNGMLDAARIANDVRLKEILTRARVKAAISNYAAQQKSQTPNRRAPVTWIPQPPFLLRPPRPPGAMPANLPIQP